MIDPLAVGGGKRLFGDDGELRRLLLVESQVTSTGRDHRQVLRGRGHRDVSYYLTMRAARLNEARA